MSWDIPSIEEENNTLADCGQIHAQLDRRDDPFGLVDTEGYVGAPPPLVAGQVLCWESRNRKHGPVERREFFKAVHLRGRLVWLKLKLGPWL